MPQLTLPPMMQNSILVPVCGLAASVPMQFSANGLGKAVDDGYILGLEPMWEIWMELWFGLGRC